MVYNYSNKNKAMSEFSEVDPTYLDRIKNIQQNIDDFPERFINFPPNQKAGIGGIVFEIPELPDTSQYIQGLKRLVPQALKDLTGVARRRNSFVIFVPSIGKGVYITDGEKRITSGENNLFGNEWRIIAVSLDAIRENQKKYPSTPWYVPAFETVLHELYEENITQTGETSPQQREQSGYVQSPLEQRARDLAITKINDVLKLDIAADNQGFVYLTEKYDTLTKSRHQIKTKLESMLKDDKLKRSPTSHVHKNDEGLGLTIGDVSDGEVSTNKVRVGLVVGNGAILSSLPDVPADVLIITDYNPFIHEWTQFTANALYKANSPEEYRSIVYSTKNPLYNELVKEGLHPEDGLADEMRDLGERHFLASTQRFRLCKSAIQRKQLLNHTVNLTDQRALQELAQVLSESNAEITFANFTNVWEHAGNGLESALPILPFNNQAVILHSSRAYTDRDNPKMMGICRGLRTYIDTAKPANNFWRNYGHYPGRR